jgi:MFS family permease
VNGDSSVLHLAFPCFVMGIGFGYVASPAVVAAQTAVDWSRRGVATGANMFARSIGSAVGVAVFGAVVNSVVSSRLGGTRPGLEEVSASVLEPAIHGVFVMTIAFAVVLVGVAALMPTRVHAPEPEPVEAGAPS